MKDAIMFAVSGVVSYFLLCGVWTIIFFSRNSANPLFFLWGAASVIPGFWWWSKIGARLWL